VCSNEEITGSIFERSGFPIGADVFVTRSSLRDHVVGITLLLDDGALQDS
jgi:hypothetical protein